MTSDEIKNSTTMTEVLSMYGLRPNRKGFICCPFHKEKTPSMKIYDKSYHCFGCGESGDVFSFVQKYQNIDFKDAFRTLGGGYESSDYLRGNVKKQVNIRKERQDKILEDSELRTYIARAWKKADEINAGLKNTPHLVFSDEHEELITLRNSLIYFWEEYILDRKEVTGIEQRKINEKCNRIFELEDFFKAN